MRIGVNHWIWCAPFKTSQHFGLISKAKSLGAEVFEFAFEDDAQFDLGAIRKALEDEDLGTSMVAIMGPDRDLSSEDAAVRHSGVDYAKRGIDTTAAMGGTVFTGCVCGVGGDKMLSDVDVTARLQRAAECLQTLGQHAAQAGVLVTVEVLNHYENNVLYSVDNGLRLVEMASHPAVGIHLDTFHMSMEESSLAGAIRKAGDKLFHFHSSESHRGTPGTGLVQWAEVADALSEINYDRYCVIESFNTDVEECWIVEFAKTWRPRAETQDDLAREGVAFLKNALRSEPL